MTDNATEAPITPEQPVVIDSAAAIAQPDLTQPATEAEQPVVPVVEQPEEKPTVAVQPEAPITVETEPVEPAQPVDPIIAALDEFEDAMSKSRHVGVAKAMDKLRIIIASNPERYGALHVAKKLQV